MTVIAERKIALSLSIYILKPQVYSSHLQCFVYLFIFMVYQNSFCSLRCIHTICLLLEASHLVRVEIKLLDMRIAAGQRLWTHICKIFSVYTSFPFNVFYLLCRYVYKLCVDHWRALTDLDLDSQHMANVFSDRNFNLHFLLCIFIVKNISRL